MKTISNKLYNHFVRFALPPDKSDSRSIFKTRIVLVNPSPERIPVTAITTPGYFVTIPFSRAC